MPSAEKVKQGLKGKTLNLSGKQVFTIEGLESIVPKSLESLDLSFNLIKEVSSHLQLLTKISHLDLSTNFIQEIQGLESLKYLKTLKLSKNRILRISNLHNNTNLDFLDLSLNAIEKVEGLQTLTKLRTLYLFGNKITLLEGMSNLTKLTELRVEQNLIEDINHLSLCSAPLQTVQAHSNNLQNLDDVIVTLGHLSKLSTLSLFNNPLARDPTYKFRVLKFQNIKNLDGLIVKDYIRNVMEEAGDDYELDQIVTNSEKAIEKTIEQEKQVKNTAVSILKKQIQQLEDDFYEFSKSLKK